MNAMGMCPHNNIGNYCPSCARENEMYNYQQSKTMRGMGRLGHYSDFAGGGMGATCPEGYYDLKIFGVSTGQCAPSLSTLTEGAQSGALSTVASGVAQSAATQQAVQSAAATTLGNKIITYVKQHPYIVFGGGAAILALVVYGGMSFARGK